MTRNTKKQANAYHIWKLLCQLLTLILVDSWTPRMGTFVIPTRRCSPSSPTYMAQLSSEDDGENEASEENNAPEKRMERLALSGVSISAQPPGFFVLLEATDGCLPLQVTSDPLDAYATTSAESLTIIQLLSRVDMAGAILPPETLARMVVLSCESLPEVFLEEPQVQVLELVQASLRKRSSNTGTDSDPPLTYSTAHPWLQQRCELPQVTLDELVLTYTGTQEQALANGLLDPSKWQCQLRCNVKSIGSLTVVATPELIQAVSYNYDATTSSLFACIALALRYKAPINLNYSDGACVAFFDEDALNTIFPQRTTVAKLQQSSTRVTQNIERGFEIHKLTKALEIARKLGDKKAEEKIRAELDAMDSFQELPTANEGADEEHDIEDSGSGENEDGDEKAGDSAAPFQ